MGSGVGRGGCGEDGICDSGDGSWDDVGGSSRVSVDGGETELE